MSEPKHPHKNQNDHIITFTIFQEKFNIKKVVIIEFYYEEM
jgi:hypothetical protein